MDICGTDTWRDPKVITLQKKSAITSYFGLRIALNAITDTIFLTILQKRENRRNDSPIDNIENAGCLNIAMVVIL